MACAEFEDLILDYCEGAASPADRTLLETHVAACTGCRAYLAVQRELDLRLAQTVAHPALSPAFEAQLAARIAQAARPSHVPWLPRVLDWTGYLSLAAAGAYLLQQLPHAADCIGLTALAASAVYSLWQTGKALRHNFGHR
jgi:anti-sigma factor RsiW